MKSNLLNYLTDAFGLICLVLLTSTGGLMFFVLPPGSGRARAIWGMTRHDWGEIHLIVAIAFLLIMVLHIYLHWNWIYRVTCDLVKEKRNICVCALLGFVALITFAVAPFFSPIVDQGSHRGHYGRNHR